MLKISVFYLDKQKSFVNPRKFYTFLNEVFTFKWGSKTFSHIVHSYSNTQADISSQESTTCLLFQVALGNFSNCLVILRALKSK